jgi:predicted RNA binding protein YcfA (HicA-like mRNA interferase family)
MSLRKDQDVILKDLEQHGYKVDTTKGGHIKVTHPESTEAVFTGSTPSEHRALKNFESQLNQKFGYQSPRKRAQAARKAKKNKSQ